MNCEAARSLLERSQNAPISAQQEEELLAHLSECSECAQIKADFDALAKWYALLEDEDAPEEFSQSWRKAIMRERPRPLPYRLMPYAAAAIVLLALAGIVGRVFAPANYDAGTARPTRFHVAGAASGESGAGDNGALYGAQDTAEAPAEMLAEEQFAMPEAAMDAAPAAGALPTQAPQAAAPMPQAESDAGAPAPKAAPFGAEESKADAEAAPLRQYYIALTANDYKSLMEHVAFLREKHSPDDLNYREISDSAGRVSSFQMHFTFNDLTNFDIWLDKSAIKYQADPPPETQGSVLIQAHLSFPSEP